MISPLPSVRLMTGILVRIKLQERGGRSSLIGIEACVVGTERVSAVVSRLDRPSS